MLTTNVVARLIRAANDVGRPTRANRIKAQPEPVIKPDGMSNDFDREGMVLVGGACFDHAPPDYRHTVKPKSM